jgi:hypothetical protein
MLMLYIKRYLLYSTFMNFLPAPNSIPFEPLPDPNGVDADAIREWHCRVPLNGLSFGIADNLRYLDGVGFTDNEGELVSPSEIPEVYRRTEFQEWLGGQIVNHRILLAEDQE